MIRAASYARYSTDMQNEQSIKDQQSACREFAKAQGFKLVKEFSDSAISGAALGNRPAMKEMLEMAYRGEFDVILMADTTRLSRNNADLTKMIERLKFRKVRVMGILDRFDSESRHARMQAGLSGIMSDEYRQAIGERTHLALVQLAKSQKPVGKPPFGYDLKRAAIPREAAVIRELFKRTAAGEPLREIMEDFNKRKLPGPGPVWLAPSASKLMTNQFYIGRVIYNRRQMVKDPDSGKRLPRKRPPSEWIVYQNRDLAIVDEKTFKAAQLTRARRTQVMKPGNGFRRFALSGLLVCGECGSKMRCIGTGRRAISRYVCSLRFNAGDSACTAAFRLDRAVAEAKLVDPVLELFLSPQAVEEAIVQIRRQLKSGASNVAPKIDTVIEGRIARLNEHVAAGLIEKELAEPLLAQLDRERAAAMRQRSKVTPMASAAEIEREYRAYVAEMREQLQSGDVDQVRAVLAQVHGEEIRIVQRGDKLVAIRQPVIGGGPRRVALGALPANGSPLEGKTPALRPEIPLT
jgi:site-specific DNA recombinase